MEENLPSVLQYDADTESVDSAYEFSDFSLISSNKLARFLDILYANLQKDTQAPDLNHNKYCSLTLNNTENLKNLFPQFSWIP